MRKASETSHFHHILCSFTSSLPPTVCHNSGLLRNNYLSSFTKPCFKTTIHHAAFTSSPTSRRISERECTLTITTMSSHNIILLAFAEPRPRSPQTNHVFAH